MVRSTLIVGLFALLLGASVYLGQLQLSHSPGPEKGSTKSASSPPQQDLTERPIELSPVSQHEVGGVLATTGSQSGAVEVGVDQQAVLPVAVPGLSPLTQSTPGFPAVPEQPLSDEQLEAAVREAKALRANRDLAASRALLSETYFGHQLSKPQRLRLAAELEPISWELLSSRNRSEPGWRYVVQPGDRLASLAGQCRVPYQFLMRINGITDPRRIRPRQTLKLVEGPFDILVELGAFELTVLRQGKFVRRFIVGIGQDDTTPTGLYTVTSKLIDPEWPDPENRRIVPPLDPENPLGTRWIGIGLGYGIHGTTDPGSIGRKVSRGCIRMRKEDVELLFDMVIEGSRVLIRS